MKICAYVQGAYAKQNYANECMDARKFVGLRVIIDVLERAGRKVEYAGSATVHEYECVLVSLTSDCDWQDVYSERVKWRAEIQGNKLESWQCLTCARSWSLPITLCLDAAKA